MDTKFKLRYCIIAIIVIVGCCTCLKVMQIYTEEQETIVITTEVPVQIELTEWELFQLALIEVESEYNSAAVSSEGAIGIFQEMPSYVREVNRLTGTEWQPNDVYNDTIALDCFTAIQWAYNPEYDIERAIYIHNPKAGSWYRRRILDKMAEIRRREQIRTLIVNY